MKLFLAIALTILLKDTAEAAACGKWHSTACLGDTDRRYDPTHTNNIIEQDTKWSDLQGYWKTKELMFDSQFQPSQPSVFNPVDTRKGRGLPYTRDAFTSYYNITVDGSRLSQTAASILPPAPQEFCDTANATAGDLNVLRGGTCGETGWVRFARNFYTSSHEKNGQIVLIAGSFSYLAFDKIFAPDAGGGYTVGDDAIYFNEEWTMGGGTAVATKIFTFTNADKTKASMTIDTFNKAFGDEYFFIGSSRIAYEKISEEEYIKGIQEEFDAQNVPDDVRPTIPSNCDGLGTCPSKDDWCKYDPNCSISPYQEPEASMKGGVVGGVVAACALVLFIAAFAYYRWRLAQEEKRVRRLVAVKIAQKLDLCVTTKESTQESISREFQSIDASGDGILQKDEVKAYFMGEGSAMKSKRNLMDDGGNGNLTEQEFETIFSVLDVDGSGGVSYVEFVTFLNQCRDEMEKVGTDKA